MLNGPVGRGGLPGVVGAPADEDDVGAQRARIVPTGGDSDERAGRWGGLPDAVVAPAGERGVGAQRTRGARLPAATAGYVPVGGSACPEKLWPQQTRVASVRTPHVWFSPAVRVVNVPLGALARPSCSRP